jgi:hypothetical protein
MSSQSPNLLTLLVTMLLGSCLSAPHGAVIALPNGYYIERVDAHAAIAAPVLGGEIAASAP